MATALGRFVDQTTGAAHKIGPDDGSNLFVPTAHYSDFRPALKFANLVLQKSETSLNNFSDLIKRANSTEHAENVDQSYAFSNSGLAIIRSRSVSAAIVAPRRRLRRFLSDPLHISVMINGKFVLVPQGIESYADKSLYGQRTSRRAFNCVLPLVDEARLSGRFTLPPWTEDGEIDLKGPGSLHTRAKLQNLGAHVRKIEVTADGLLIIDRIDAYFGLAGLNFIVAATDGVRSPSGVSFPDYSIEFSAPDIGPIMLSKEAWSDQYGSSRDGTRIEVRFPSPKTTIRTLIRPH
jgi:hypothetical protein